MCGPSDAIRPYATLRGCDRLCHRSVAAQQLCRRDRTCGETWVLHAVCQRCCWKGGGGWMCWGGVGLGGAEAAALNGCLQGDTVSRVKRDKQTQMATWRRQWGRWRRKWRRKTGRCTDKQSGGGDGSVLPAESSNQKHTAWEQLHCCYSGATFVGPLDKFWTNFMLTGR